MLLIADKFGGDVGGALQTVIKIPTCVNHVWLCAFTAECQRMGSELHRSWIMFVFSISTS